MNELDLDALEKRLRAAYLATFVAIDREELRALIRRLREAEARSVPIEPGDIELFGGDPYRSARSWHDAWMKSEARIAQLEAELALATSIDPRTYGAVSNGVTDDTPAFQAAVDIAHLGSENMKLRARIEALEWVREAAAGVLAQSEDIDWYDTAQPNYDALRSALATVEEPVKL